MQPAREARTFSTGDLVGHEGKRYILLIEGHLIQFTGRHRIILVELNAEQAIADPPHRRLPDQERRLGRRNQKERQYHPDLNVMGSAQAPAGMGEIGRDAARVECAVGIVDGTGNRHS